MYCYLNVYFVMQRRKSGQDRFLEEVVQRWERLLISMKLFLLYKISVLSSMKYFSIINVFVNILLLFFYIQFYLYLMTYSTDQIGKIVYHILMFYCRQTLSFFTYNKLYCSYTFQLFTFRHKSGLVHYKLPHIVSRSG